MERIALKTFINLLIVFGLTLPHIGFCQTKDLEEVKSIKEEIQIINLLNNLDLRQGQIEFIIQKATEAKAIREDIHDKLSANKSRLVESYDAIKEEVSQGRVNLNAKEKRDFHKVQRETEEAISQAYDKIDAIAAVVEGRLESFQLVALDNYKACVIPIMQEGRIGQSDSPTGLVKILEKIKDMPDERYIKKKDILVKRMTDQITKKKYMGIRVDETEIKSRILKIFDKARNMSEVDFMINKESLAKQLKEDIIPARKTASRTDKIKKFLLSDKIIPILEDRLSKRK